eukprot:1158319-Pelagomonas_calceolata.AAC.7
MARQVCSTHSARVMASVVARQGGPWQAWTMAKDPAPTLLGSWHGVGAVGAMRHVQASPVRNQHGIPVSVVNKERMHGRHVVCVLHMLTCRWALWSKTLNPGCIHFGYTSDAQSTRSLGSPDLNGRIARALIMRHEPNMVGAFFAIPTSTRECSIDTVEELC